MEHQSHGGINHYLAAEKLKPNDNVEDKIELTKKG